MNIFERARVAWAAFRGRDHPKDYSSGDAWGRGNHVTQFGPPYGNGGGRNDDYFGPSSADRPGKVVLSPSNEKTIVNCAWNRIALDVAAVEFHHAKIDENENFREVVKGSIEDALTIEANIDQTSHAYMIDLVLSMFDEGCVAEVPVECDRVSETDRKITDKLPLNLRLGKIVQWRPDSVKIDLLNEYTGRHEQVDMPKRDVCIHENPFASVMNKKNSIFVRLAHKMALLDSINELQGSPKLNMIIQLPYTVRTDNQRDQARARLKEMQEQLKQSELGITYTDGTEKIVQLNRPVENSLQSQIEWLTDLLFTAICITKEILNGTADEKTMANYMNRCIGEICTGIVAERRRKLLTKEQRDNSETILFTQDPFKLIPVTSIADISDKLTRNAILSPNEVRGIIGYKPVDDPTADQLVNRNMPINQTPDAYDDTGEVPEEGYDPSTMEQSAIPKLSRQQQRALLRKIAKQKSQKTIRGPSG